MAGSGLKDTTRVASGDPVMSFGFVKTNSENLKIFIKEFIYELSNLIEIIDSDQFLEVAKKVKEVRDKIW